jgi:hypothetical protein
MILSGAKLSGVNYIGTPSLNTIGTPAWYFDYRFNRTSQLYSGIERVNSLGDLSPSQIVLQSGPVSSNTRRPKVFSDSIGMDDNITNFSGSNFSGRADFVVRGAPCLMMAVVSINDAIGNTINFPGSSGSPSFNFRVEISNMRLSCVFVNDAGSNIGNNVTPVSSIPLNEFILVQRLYYGSGTGSNNLKMIIKNSVTTLTYNPTFASNSLGTFNFSSNGTVDHRFKMSIGYDLTGKSPAQCDAFQALAVATLKADPEYASLVT